MGNIVCKTCGGTVTRKGNYYVCDYCHSKWMVDVADDVHAVERANAWEALRNNDFEKAAELFENIILKDPKNHEAYWGRALSLAGIVYVTDMNENKKVPTCNNITEESFVDDKDVKTAISLAPQEIADGYKQQAEYIEKVRIEWLEKASKEPSYDVFISFKDSDRENGIERTQDSIDAQDLYNALLAEGCKVFFSRISLRDKVAEQYEPYIYNAIKTAKVMIVFGEKAEYFSSVWIKNEWSRFKTRIEKGEKHKNSLVVVYKNMAPADLPTVLKNRQCLNAADMTFLPTLTRHIKRVIDETTQAVHIDRIEIKGGQISKKSSQIKQESLQTREIGSGAIAETSIDEKQKLSLAQTFLNGKQWDDAEKLIDDLLFDNPNYDEAIWLKLYVKYRCSNNAALYMKVRSFTTEDYATIEKMLNCTNKIRAETILVNLYAVAAISDENTCLKVLQLILPFDYRGRARKISEIFDTAIEKNYYQVFKLLLTTLDENDVDSYIAYNLAYAEKTNDDKLKSELVENVLAVHEGNVEALKLRFDMQFKCKSAPELIKSFEEILKYSSQTNETVIDTLCQFSKELYRKEHCAVAKQILKYYSGELAEIKLFLLNLAYRIIEQGFFEEAEYFLSLILTVNANDPDVYWGICLVKVKAKNEDLIVQSDIPLKQVPEYMKYLTLVDESRRQHCINIANNQAQNIQKREIERKKQEKERQIKEEERRKNEEAARKRREEERRIEIARKKRLRRIRIRKITIAAAVLILIAVIVIPIIVEKNERNWCTMTSLGDSWAVTGIETNNSKIIIPETYKGKPVTAIGDEAFSKSLKSITIPASITSIGENAFYECESITSVYYTGTIDQWAQIEFYDWYSSPIHLNSWIDKIDKAKLYINNELVTEAKITTATKISDCAFGGCTSLTSVTIGSGVTSIGDRAFKDCSSLTSVTIPDSVTSIGDFAFDDCTSLTSINYTGTLKQWLNIKKYGMFESSYGSYTVYCTDGTTH